MSKKMKRVAFDSSFDGASEHSRARFKHQTLLQDFLELQQETEAQRKNLTALKQKESILKAEVSFLRRRRDFLLKNKPTIPQECFSAKPKPTRLMKSKKDKNFVEKAQTLCNPVKKKALRVMPVAPVFDLNLENGVNGNGAIHGSSLNQKGGPVRGQEQAGQTRSCVIDLNQISREEEEMQVGFEPFADQTQGLVRNVGVGLGLGSTSRPGKRKISWQDPVALRV